MPLNVRRFYTSVLLVLVSFILISPAQTVTPPASAPVQTSPTSGDIMRERISKAKAFIAVRNYNAAIYELENIRKESGDTAVQGVVNVLLMNSYLEQGDYKRAQDMLGQFYNLQKTTRPNAAAAYAAVAGQVIKGARSRAERYRSLGLSVTDRTLPLEALNDLEKMRETVEIVITESKEIGKTPSKTIDAMGLLEEATNSRSMLARDDYDARHWKDEVADTREVMANSRSIVTSAIAQDTPNSGQLATNTKPVEPPPVIIQPVSDIKPAAGTREREVKQAEPVPTKTDEPIYIPSAPRQANDEPKQQVALTPKTEPVKTDPPKPDPPKPEEPKATGPIDVGSLVAYATKQSSPVYPAQARTMRATGLVKVEVTVDEAGDVAEIQKTSGPSLLQNAAKDAIKKWKFKPFVRDGQPVRATGFVSFNFAL